jgi:predicted nucleotide-binding protein
LYNVNLNNSITFCHINPYFDKVKNKVELNILFDIHQSFELESTDVSSVYSNEIILHNLACTVTLKSSDNVSTKEYLFEKDPRENRISNGDNLLLTRVFDNHELKDLIKWRVGRIVTIRWQFFGNGQAEIDGNTYLVNLTSFYDRSSIFPVINDEQWEQIIKLKEVNNNEIMNTQSDKDGKNAQSRMLDDLLNYTQAIRKSKDSDKYGVWQARIERTIEKIFGRDSTELNQIKRGMELHTVFSTGQSEEEMDEMIRRDDEERFDQIEGLLNDFLIEAGADQIAHNKENSKEDKSKNIFIVHGHDELAVFHLEKIIRDFDLNPIILKDQANKGRTLIQKFEEEAKNIVYAFVIYTPDDNVMKQSEEYQQARPNVIFELGWFCAKIGRENVSIVYKKGTKIPTDLAGIVTIEYENKIDEKHGEIMRELKSARLI